MYAIPLGAKHGCVALSPSRRLGTGAQRGRAARRGARSRAETGAPCLPAPARTALHLPYTLPALLGGGRGVLRRGNGWGQFTFTVSSGFPYLLEYQLLISFPYLFENKASVHSRAQPKRPCQPWERFLLPAQVPLKGMSSATPQCPLPGAGTSPRRNTQVWGLRLCLGPQLAAESSRRLAADLEKPLALFALEEAQG